MSATYDINLADNISWVRFLIGDSNVSGTNAMLQDEEIAALLAAAPSNGASGGLSSAVYYAAATALAKLHTAWMSKGRGTASKKVSRLSIVYGSGSGINVDIALQAKIAELRKEGARLLAPAPYAFRVI